MSFPENYPGQKLWQGVEALATGTKTIQERLQSAFASTVGLQNDTWPASASGLRDRWNKLVERYHNTANLSDQEAKAQAQEFYEIFIDLYDHPNRPKTATKG